MSITKNGSVSAVMAARLGDKNNLLIAGASVQQLIVADETLIIRLHLHCVMWYYPVLNRFHEKSRKAYTEQHQANPKIKYQPCEAKRHAQKLKNKG